MASPESDREIVAQSGTVVDAALVEQEYENLWNTVTSEMQQTGRSFEDENTTEEKETIEEAEAHLGGPYTVPGTTRATWAFGGDAADHVSGPLRDRAVVD